MDKCKCKRCGHVWYKRVLKDPVLCPSCKNPKWNEKRKNKPLKEAEV